jgi:tetratricopeptide (TPR) repeat protein
VRPKTFRAVRVLLALACALALAPAAVCGGADDPVRERFQSLERAIQTDPENLELGASYRMLAIESAQFDRAIDFLEKAAKRKGSGPNVQISLALAYADKVPPSGDIRRLYLGRDAMNALSRSIALRPCALAYYFRGRINLYYNKLIFHRTDKGIADLEHALSLTTSATPPALLARIYTSLGDGYFRFGNLPKARDVWSIGVAKFPDDAALRRRLETESQELESTVGQALAAERRTDTSLSGLLPVP